MYNRMTEVNTLVADMLDLFHAVPANNWGNGADRFNTLLNQGIIFVNEAGIVRDVPSHVAIAALNRFGVSNGIWSESFHKSWDKVANAPIEQLVFEQFTHYISTYGREMFGLDPMPMIPVERVLTDPATRPNVRAFTVIRVVNNDTMYAMIERYVRTVKAPHKDKVQAIIRLMELIDIDVDDIASFELKIARCDQRGIVPQNPQDFLRYVCYKMTGKTTLIKDKATFRAIAVNHNDFDVKTALMRVNPIALASVFYRFKPLFLAMRKCEGCAPIINRIRRLATVYHNPCNDMMVANVMSMLTEGRYDDVDSVLSHCDVRTLIKLVNFANAELAAIESGLTAHVYNIRNGKVYVRTADERNHRSNFLRELRRRASVKAMARTSGMLEGKVYYIPDYVDYPVPVSEKQYIGTIPYGTIVHGGTDKRMVAAVHWENYNGYRTDLDLHMQSANGQSFGWNSGYRSDDRAILYSGDMTDATNGAVEAFSFVPTNDETYLLTISNFTAHSGVPFEFFMTNKDFNGKKYDRCKGGDPVVDVADAMFTPIPLKFDDSNSQTIGYFNGSDFVFYGGELGMSIVPKGEMYNDALKGIVNRCNEMTNLQKFIELAGGRVINDQAEFVAAINEGVDVIDLSPGNLTDRTLIDIVDGVN